jgi:hypothetical protein
MIKYKKIAWDIRTKLLHIAGLMTYQYRMTPNFLIIGVQKGGTSSLFYYLKYHPQVRRPIKKEMHFFNTHYSKGLKWYKAHFPLKSKNKLTGEASPDYIFHPLSAERVRQLNPDMKLIILLRNPVERAYSAYQMNRRLGVDPRSTFQEAVDFELSHHDKFANQYNDAKHNFFYLERGKYAAQLSVWLNHFPKEQFLVINSQSFFENTSDELLKIYSFLKIDPVLPPTYKPMNVGNYPTLSKKLSANLRQYLESDLSILKEKWNIEFPMT